MESISSEEIREMMDRDEDFVVVSAVPADEFERGHIPGAVNIPVERSDFESRFQRIIPDRERFVVVYCSSDECEDASKAVERVEEMGYSNVHQFFGGLEKWKNSGFAVEKSTLKKFKEVKG